MEVTIEFTDLTMIESNGDYQKTNELMTRELNNNWTLQTDIYIKNDFGVCKMTVQFSRNKNVVISNFTPSLQGQTLYNPDIPMFSTWVQERGWNVPIPEPGLVRLNIHFWKHFWETRLVNSQLLEQKFGKRDGE